MSGGCSNALYHNLQSKGAGERVGNLDSIKVQLQHHVTACLLPETRHDAFLCCLYIHVVIF